MGILAANRLYENRNQITAQESTSWHAFKIAFPYANWVINKTPMCKGNTNREQCIAPYVQELHTAVKEEATIDGLDYTRSVAFWTDGMAQYDLFEEFAQMYTSLPGLPVQTQSAIKAVIDSLETRPQNFIDIWRKIDTLAKPKQKLKPLHTQELAGFLI